MFPEPKPYVAIAKLSTLNGNKIRTVNGQSLNTEKSNGLQLELQGKRVALLVSPLNDKYRPTEFEAMVAVLYKANVKLDVVIGDGIQGLDLTNQDCAQKSEQEIEKEIFSRGVDVAKNWEKQVQSIIIKYNEKSQQEQGTNFITVRYCFNPEYDKPTDTKLSEIPRSHSLRQDPLYQQYKKQIKMLPSQKAKDFSDRIVQTQLIFLRNKSIKAMTAAIQNNSSLYIRLESPDVMVIDTIYDHMVYPSSEAPVFTFLRNLIPEEQRAGFIAFELSTKDPAKMTAKSIQNLNASIGKAAIQSTSVTTQQSYTKIQQALTQIPSSITIKRSQSCPPPSSKTDQELRVRSSSGGDKPKNLDPDPTSTPTFLPPVKYTIDPQPTSPPTTPRSSITTTPPSSPPRRNGNQINPTQQVMEQILAENYEEAKRLLVTSNGHIPPNAKTRMLLQITHMQQQITQMQLLSQLMPYEQNFPQSDELPYQQPEVAM